VAATGLMLSLVGGYTDLAGSKRKSCNRFSKPNFEYVPKPRQVRQLNRRFISVQGAVQNLLVLVIIWSGLNIIGILGKVRLQNGAGQLLEIWRWLSVVWLS
jgi:hypothetical protein